MNIKKIWLPAIGVIILGVLGNALWEILFKPIGGIFLRFILNISTLGAESFKNEIYIEIAKGFHEEVSLIILLLFLGSMIGFIISVSIKVLIYNDKNPQLKKVSKIQKVMDSRTFIILYALFFIAIVFIIIFQKNYINKSIVYYYQLEKIASPYVNQNQKLEMQAKFAQIKTRQDYVNIINQLTSIIENNHQTTPDPGLIF